MQEGPVNHDYEQEVKRLAEWLSDPENAEPCDGFPGDADALRAALHE